MSDVKDRYARQIKKTHIKDHITLGGKVVDIVSRLAALEADYPGCYLEWHYEEYEFYYDKEEIDEEYSERLAQLKAKEHVALEKKKAQYEKLKKELGLDDQA